MDIFCSCVLQQPGTNTWSQRVKEDFSAQKRPRKGLEYCFEACRILLGKAIEGRECTKEVPRGKISMLPALVPSCQQLGEHVSPSAPLPPILSTYDAISHVLWVGSAELSQCFPSGHMYNTSSVQKDLFLPPCHPTERALYAFCAQGHTPLVYLWFQPWLWWKLHGSPDPPCAGSSPSTAMALWRTYQPCRGRGVTSLGGSPQPVMEGVQWINAHIYFSSHVTNIFEKIGFSLLLLTKGESFSKCFRN